MHKLEYVSKSACLKLIKAKRGDSISRGFASSIYGNQVGKLIIYGFHKHVERPIILINR